MESDQRTGHEPDQKLNQNPDQKAGQKHALPAEAGFGSGLTTAIHSGFGITSPFTREIFLARQAIVGMRFQGGSDELIADLAEGSRISFLREPENRFDEKAIMALDENGRKLGYIPRNDNTILAALMDAGKYLYGVVCKEPSDYYNGSNGRFTPTVLMVNLYMREFAMPGDPDQIPRQGYRGSYVVMELNTTEGREEGPKISSACAIRVINGEERGIFLREVSADRKCEGIKGDPDEDKENKDIAVDEGKENKDIAADEGKENKDIAADKEKDNKDIAADQDMGAEDIPEDSYEKLARGLQRFTGYLPVVLHDVDGQKQMALENAWGIYTGKPFSNLVIDIRQMAENHLPRLRNYSLENIADSLGIMAGQEPGSDPKQKLESGSEQKPESDPAQKRASGMEQTNGLAAEMEMRCRIIWRIYYRFDRSELKKRPEVISGKRKQGKNETIYIEINETE